jgi:hypothetical protein
MCSRTGAAEHSVCSVCECPGIWRMCYRAYWKREQACEPARIATEHDTCARPCCRHITQHGISFATEHAVSCDNNLILAHLSRRRSSTATEHAGGTATEHRGTAMLQSMLVELQQSIVERQVGNRCSSLLTSTEALFSGVLLQNKPCASELCQRTLGRRALCRRALLNNKKSCEC